MVRRALISVYDKTDVVDFAKTLAQRNVEILSTGGTAKILRESGVEIREVSDYTGFPEMLDGRVKTLHPKIHAGLLAVRENTEHIAQTLAHGVALIDLVVSNLSGFNRNLL